MKNNFGFHLNPNGREEQDPENVRRRCPRTFPGWTPRFFFPLFRSLLAAGVLFIACPDVRGASLPYGEHYSPRENLEQTDIRVLSSAHRSIDIAMYAFTDREIAYTLAMMAKKGIRIRIYRDRMQIRDKNDRSGWLLRQSPNIRIRIKRNSSRNIMHLKAYLVDGTILRTGSANWSPPGEGAFGCNRHPFTCHQGRWQQDNNLFLSNDRRLAEEFERTFERLWNRPSNIRHPDQYIERVRHRKHRSRGDGSRY